MRAGDIGYHFIIDRAGRIWEGRPLIYQGAHVKDENEHNLGIMTLGNFDRQSPTTAQLMTLQHMLAYLRHQYSVPVSKVYTHQELNPTACPGLHLQPRIVAMRKNGLVG
jgi:N-acetyl-anhydromuramyl-L-alanine amidase AmpD